MKLEKRSDGGGGEPEPLPEESHAGEKKPVIVYILLLFVMAFLLMAMSFAMHQRSSGETLTDWPSSAVPMDVLQEAQDRILTLEDELQQAKKSAADLEEQLGSANLQSSAYSMEIHALETLYCLQQYYEAEDYDSCQVLIQEMEEDGYAEYLPDESLQEGIPSLSSWYQNLKSAVTDQQSEGSESSENGQSSENSESSQSNENGEDS